MFGQVFLTFHIHRVTTTTKKGLVKSFKPTDTHRSTNNEISRNCFGFVFFLFTDKHIKRWNISRDETAEVEHGVRFSGDTRLFSTHTVTFRKDMQEENTKHRYDTDYILFSTADSGFSARTLARAVCLDVNQTLSCFTANLQRLVSMFRTCLRLELQHHYTNRTHTHTPKHTCKHEWVFFFRVPSEIVRKPLTSGSQRAGIQYWI